MKAELFITKDRIPYIIEVLGEDRVTVTEHGGSSDLVSFEATYIDLLNMFHAGIRYGSDTMANALIKK